MGVHPYGRIVLAILLHVPFALGARDMVTDGECGRNALHVLLRDPFPERRLCFSSALLRGSVFNTLRK